MTQLSKKIHIQKTNGTLQTCCLYSSKSDIQDKALPLTVDGSTCYAALVAESDSRATGGRVQPTGGAVYALATEAKKQANLTVTQPAVGNISINGQVGTSFRFDQNTRVTVAATMPAGYKLTSLYVNGNVVTNSYTFAISSDSFVYATYAIAYTETNYTTGSGVFTVPTGVNRLRVAICGGGGGGNGGYNSGVRGDAGGTTIFGDLVATGGGTGEGANGSPSTTQADSTTHWGYALSFGVSSGGYGQGGYPSNRSTQECSSSGGYLSTYITVSSGQQIIYSVGTGGKANSYDAGGRDGTVATDGTGGFVLIAFGSGINN